MFRSLKMQIYLLAFVPLTIIAVTSLVGQVRAMDEIHLMVSKVSTEAIVEIEKNRFMPTKDIYQVGGDLYISNIDGICKYSDIKSNKLQKS